MLHYLIHAYDDPEHAQQGLKAARAYAQAAAAVPHALHMPSHIFTRLGYWDESAATNLRGWEVSEADVKRAGESGAYRDFHNLTYLEYAYLQLGRFRDAQRTVDIIAAQYQALPDKKTAPDTPELQSRHVRGRTIYAVPDRVVSISLQAKEAESFAAEEAGDADTAVARLKEAVAIEDSIDDLWRPPYPAIPASELCGNLPRPGCFPPQHGRYLADCVESRRCPHLRRVEVVRTSGKPSCRFGHGSGYRPLSPAAGGQVRSSRRQRSCLHHRRTR